MRLSCVLCLCCLALHAFADETNLTITVGSETYSNVTFGAVTPAAVTAFHSTGITSIPLEKLPLDLQQRFGHEPNKAAQYRQAEAKARQQAANRERQLQEQKRADAELRVEAEKLAKNATETSGKVLAVLPEGIVVKIGVDGSISRRIAPSATRTTAFESHRIFMIGHPGQLAEGDTVHCYAAQSGVVDYEGSTLQQWFWVSEYSPAPPPAPKTDVDAFGRTKQADPNIRRLGEHP